MVPDLRPPSVPMSIPRRILVAGDWHGNLRWATSVIQQVPHLLADEQSRIVLQLGDFGVWPGDEVYTTLLTDALIRADANLWFVDGNHEEHPKLSALLDGWDGTAPVRYRERIWWLPRGYRWQWHGRTWLALGGAASLDRAGLVSARGDGQMVRVPNRTRGTDWWPEEEITDEQELAVIAGGKADVMVTHDCPGQVTNSFPPRPSWWSPLDLERSERHAERLQRVGEAVQPSHLM